MTATNADRYRSVIQHMRSVNYAPHELIIDILADRDSLNAQERVGLQRAGGDMLRGLLPGNNMAARVLQCIFLLDYTPHAFVIDFLSAADVSKAHGHARAQFQMRAPEILGLLLPGPRSRTSAALLCLRILGSPFVDIVRDLLGHEDDYASARDVLPLLDTISRFSPESALDWAFLRTESIYRREMHTIISKSAGFHANASHLQPEQIEQFDLPAMGGILRERAPHLWRLFSIVSNASGHRRRLVGPSERAPVVLDAGGDLGGQDDRIILVPPCDSAQTGSGDVPMDVDSIGDGDTCSQTPSAGEQRTRGQSSRTDRTEELRIIHMFGIAQQSSNAQCNAIQTFMGIFMRTNRVPSMVISVLNHLGIVIGSDSIDSACKSLAAACKQRLALQGQSLRAQLAYDNFNFLQHVAVPIAGRGNTFISAISAILIHSHPCLTREHFRYADILWWKNPANELPRFPPNPSPFVPSYMDIINIPFLLDPRASGGDFDPAEDQLDTLAWHIRRILVQQGVAFASYADLLGEPPEVLKIPLHKTDYMPMEAMNLNQSKTGDNSRALDNLFDQMKFPPEAAAEYITLIHGDMGASERILASQADRCDEDQPLSQFKNVVDAPGLFHYRMANADCLHRLYLSPPAARHDQSSFWKYLKVLRSPSEQAKFTASSGPGFRRMNDVSSHITWALILECWSLQARAWDASCTSLESFAKTLASKLRCDAWDIIVSLSRKIATTYVADGSFFAMRSKPTNERDQVFENWALYLQHSLMDQVLSYAIKSQDVGRVAVTLYDWMFIYHATKKHKYAHHTLRILTNIAHVFPKPFRHAFLMSWIINPSGKSQGGRGVDWLVELFNLYLKTVHCGSSSNYGLDRMIESSTLISLFKVVFDSFVLHYRVMTHNVHHAAPDMAETLRRLRRDIAEDEALVYTPGRTTPFEYSDALAVGQAGFMDGSLRELSLAEKIDIILPHEIEDFFDMDTELD